MSALSSYQKITATADYKNIAQKGQRCFASAFVLQVLKTPAHPPCLRVGLTVSRKVGTAVVRNKVKRRLRAMLQKVIPALCVLHAADFVIVAKPMAHRRDFIALERDLISHLVQSGLVQRP